MCKLIKILSVHPNQHFHKHKPFSQDLVNPKNSYGIIEKKK